MGKCFLLQVRKILALVSRYRHNDPPEAMSTIEAYRYPIQLFAAKFMLGKNHITSYVYYGYYSLESCKVCLKNMFNVTRS